MATTLNLTHDQGASFLRSLTIKDSSNVAINLTSYTLRGQARKKYADEAAAFSFVFTIKDQGTNPGEVDMTLAPSVTSALSIKEPTEYLYDVELVSAGGEVTRLFQGTITLSPEVTK